MVYQRQHPGSGAESFTLKPHLVRITSIASRTPSSLVSINDYRGHHEHHVERLAASSNPVDDRHLPRRPPADVCCGAHVRHTVHYSNRRPRRTTSLHMGRQRTMPMLKVAVGEVLRARSPRPTTPVKRSRPNNAQVIGSTPLPGRVEIGVSQNGNAFARTGRDRTAESGREHAPYARDNAHQGRPGSDVATRAVKVFWHWNLPEQRQEQEGVASRRIGVPGFTCAIDEGHQRDRTPGFESAWARSVPVSRGQGERHLHLPETLVATAYPPRPRSSVAGYPGLRCR